VLPDLLLLALLGVQGMGSHEAGDDHEGAQRQIA
jgi:hypothetical protein